MCYVIKKDGKKEVLDEEKIKNSIRKAVIDAGQSLEAKKKIIDSVSKAAVEMAEEKETVKSQALKKFILARLGKVDVPAAKSWRRFDRKYKSW
jgi:transcriptional repressor NrdR